MVCIAYTLYVDQWLSAVDKGLVDVVVFMRCVYHIVQSLYRLINELIEPSCLYATMQRA
jgi:hypothetical protein